MTVPPVAGRAIARPAIAFLALSVLATRVVAGTDPLTTFLAWFPGEYDNHEQVWQAAEDEAPEPHEHIHHIILPVTVPGLGKHIFYVEQTLAGDPARIYRQRLYEVRPDPASGALRMAIWSFPDPTAFHHAHLRPAILRDLTPEDLRGTPGCEVYWRLAEDGDAFTGTLRDGGCAVTSVRTGEPLRIRDELRLTPEELWIRDEAFDPEGQRVFGRADGIPHRNRKVQYYTGWAGVKRRGPAAAPDDDAWQFMPALRVHNEGQIVPIVDRDGQPTGYSLQLARLTYQNTRVPILKLGLIEDRTGATLVYSWADPGADRIGINIRWAQIGLTLKAEDTAFGFLTAVP